MMPNNFRNHMIPYFKSMRFSEAMYRNYIR